LFFFVLDDMSYVVGGQRASHGSNSI